MSDKPSFVLRSALLLPLALLTAATPQYASSSIPHSNSSLPSSTIVPTSSPSFSLSTGVNASASTSFSFSQSSSTSVSVPLGTGSFSSSSSISFSLSSSTPLSFSSSTPLSFSSSTPLSFSSSTPLSFSSSTPLSSSFSASYSSSSFSTALNFSTSSTPVISPSSSVPIITPSSSIPLNISSSSIPIISPSSSTPIVSPSSSIPLNISSSSIPIISPSSSTPIISPSSSIPLNISSSSTPIISPSSSTPIVSPSSSTPSISPSSSTPGNPSSSSTAVVGVTPPAVITIPTTINGVSTQVIAISGGDITTPAVLTPTITIAPSGTAASSSKSALQTQISSIIPIIQGWIDDTSEDVTPVIQSLDDTEKTAEDILSDIEGDSDHDTSKGCTHSLFSLVSCIVDSVSKIQSSLENNDVDDVVSELTDLQNLTTELDNNDDDNNSSSQPSSSQPSSSQPSSSQPSSSQPSSSQPSSSSTTTCTSGTSITEDYYITCTPTVVSSTSTNVCNTATSTVSGCSVSAYTTATTVSAGSSSIPFLCAQTGCAVCTDDSLPPEPTIGCSDCTTVNGVVYPPQQTTVPSDAPPVTDPNSLGSGNSTSQKKKRSLPTPYDYPASDAQTSYEAFFQAQLATAGLINVPHRWGGTGGSSSAVLRGLDANSRLYMSVQGLFGCTSLVLISRQAVYMSHMFENPGFVKYNQTTGAQIPSDFNADIAQAIPNGDPTPINQGTPVDGEPYLPDLNALSAAGQVFDPAQEGGVRAILLTPGPFAGQAGTYRYDNEVNTILNWVTRFDADPLTYIYTSTNGQISNDQTTPTGKILVQYDPAESTAYEKFNLGNDQYTCPVQYAGVKVWIGYQEFFGNGFDPYWSADWAVATSDTIAPLPIGGGLILNRDDSAPNACVRDGASSSLPSTVPSSTPVSSPGSTPPGSSSIPTVSSSSPISSASSSSSLPPVSSSSSLPPVTSSSSLPPVTSSSSTLPSSTAPPSTSSPPPSTTTPSPVSTAPLADQSVVCFNEADFPGHGDINGPQQEDFAISMCSKLSKSSITMYPPGAAPTGSPDIPGIEGFYSDEHGINYAYLISWIDGCVTTQDGQNVTDPDGWTGYPCGGLFANNYYDCNNGGVGGWTQAGCLNFSFVGALGDAPACQNCLNP